MTSWADRKKKLQEKTKESAENREGKSSTIFTFKNIGDREVIWADKPKSGRENNEYDFIPFIITEDWYKDFRKFTGKKTNLEPGDVDYKLEYPQHKLPTGETFLCLKEAFGQPCGGCEHVEDLIDQGPKKGASKKEIDAFNQMINQMKAKWRCIYNIIDLNGKEDVVLWDHSYHLFEKLILTEIQLGNEGLELFWDIEDGKTVSWRGMEKKLGKYPFIQADRIDFEDREPYDENILDEAYPLDKILIIPKYQDTVRLATGSLPDDSDSDEPEEKSNRSNRRNTEKKDEAEEEKSTRSNRRSRFNKEETKEDQEDDIPESVEHKSVEGECPENKEFGVDFDQYDECQNCPNNVYDNCQKENEHLKEEAEKEEKENKSSGRRNNKRDKKEEKEPEENTSSRRRSRRR